MELEEPFSESEDEEATGGAKNAAASKSAKPRLALPMPRRRIRTLSGMVAPVGYAPTWGGPTMCLGCLEFFDLPGQTRQYVDHLLSEHRIVITDIELIVDLKRSVGPARATFVRVAVSKITKADENAIRIRPVQLLCTLPPWRSSVLYSAGQITYIVQHTQIVLP